MVSLVSIALIEIEINRKVAIFMAIKSWHSK
jgi:hypothetical protein